MTWPKIEPVIEWRIILYIELLVYSINKLYFHCDPPEMLRLFSHSMWIWKSQDLFLLLKTRRFSICMYAFSSHGPLFLHITFRTNLFSDLDLKSYFKLTELLDLPHRKFSTQGNLFGFYILRQGIFWLLAVPVNVLDYLSYVFKFKTFEHAIKMKKNILM